MPIRIVKGDLHFYLGEQLYGLASANAESGAREKAQKLEAEAKGSFMDAAREYRAAHARVPGDRTLFYQCCESWLHAEKWHRAMRYIDTLLTKVPEENYLLEYKGRFLLQREKLDEALDVFNMLIQKEKESIAYRVYRGVTFFFLSHIDKPQKALYVEKIKDEWAYILNLPPGKLAKEKKMSNADIVMIDLRLLALRIQKHGRRRVRRLATLVLEKCLDSEDLHCELIN